MTFHEKGTNTPAPPGVQTEWFVLRLCWLEKETEILEAASV